MSGRPTSSNFTPHYSSSPPASGPGPASSPRGISYKRSPSGHAAADYFDAKTRSGSSTSLSSLPYTTPTGSGTPPRHQGSPHANGQFRATPSTRASGSPRMSVSQTNGSTSSRPGEDVFGGGSPRQGGTFATGGSRSRRPAGSGIPLPSVRPGESRRLSGSGPVHQPRAPARRVSEASTPGGTFGPSLGESYSSKRPGPSRRETSTGTRSPAKPFPDISFSQASLSPSPSKIPQRRASIALPGQPGGGGIGVLQPTPERVEAGPSRLALRHKSSEIDLAAAAKNSRTTSPSGVPPRPGSRRTSYHLSQSTSSRSSLSLANSPRDSPGFQDGGSIRDVSNDGVDVVDLSSSGSEFGLGETSSRTADPSPSSETVQPALLRPIEIPVRTSSTSPKAGAMQPQISPRKSSMTGLVPRPTEESSLETPPRRASRNIDLGGIYESKRPPHSPQRPSPAGSPTPSRTQLDPRGSPSKSPSPAFGRKPSPFSSPRTERKSPNPNLTINLPVKSPAQAVAASARPSPPVPMKSPLRSMSRATAAGLEIKDIRPAHQRTDSYDSNKATAGWLTPSETPPALEESLLRPDPQTVKDLPDIPTPTTAEIRFTMFTAPSVYSQDSAPPSSVPTTLDTGLHSAVPSVYTDDSSVQQRTSWPGNEATTMLPENEGLHGPISASKKITRMDNIGWGKKKSQDTINTTFTLSPRSPQPPQFNKDLPVPSFADHSRSTTPASFESHSTAESKPVRSPSMPNMSPATLHTSARLLGINGASPVPRPMARTVTEPSPLLPSVLARSPTTPNMMARSPTGFSSMSKRAHLLREIATTERAYANDLALVRDAFLPRRLRPTSQHSVGDSAVSPGVASEASQRSSTYTYQTAETKRSSGVESSTWTLSGTTPNTPYKEGSVDGYFQHPTPKMSPAISSRQSTTSLTGSIQPSGKALSSTDLKAVFLNLADIAAVAEDLAGAFEDALGDEESYEEGRGGETGPDRLGEAFVDMIPRLRPLYLAYCARQAAASTRLRELQTDPGHMQYISDCWSVIKPHTHAWNLDSMLIKPVQRITKYPLLFDDLLARTTPVHPDYFSIRSAAERSREMAMDLDEAKRRKDVVASVINKRSIILSPAKETKPKGLKLFRKDKTNGSTQSLAMSISSSDLGPPPDIPASAHLQLKELTAKVEEAEQVVRRVGKEIVFWVAAAKDLFTIEDGMVRTWLRVIQLEASDPIDQRLGAFKKVIADIVATAWTPLNEEVKERILPIFARLLEISTNPNKVIARRAAKSSDYARYIQLRDGRRAIERTLLASASDFYALHSQLLDELPAFLEGHSRILDIALVAFAKAQARYHRVVRDKLGEYARTWIPAHRRSSMSPRLGDEEVDARSGRGIVKAWHDSWAPYSEAMDHFQCARPARNLANRIASFNARPGSRSNGNSRPGSPAPLLRHSPSLSSSTSRAASPVAGRSDQRRQRSTSLLSQGPTAAPAKDSRFGLFRQHSRSSVKEKIPVDDRASKVDRAQGQMLPPPVPSQNLRVPISSPMESTNRHSFGLPKIPADPSRPIFGGLGLSPHQSPAAIRAVSESSAQTPSSQTPSSQTPSSQTPSSQTPSSQAPSSQAPSPRFQLSERTAPLGDTLRFSLLSQNAGLGLGNIEISAQAPIPLARESVPREVDDAAEGWRNEPVLYQCACVADFDPARYGSKKYRGLRFLRIQSGDLVDVFHEVGRIDELPRFPYPEIGVDNDGALVGRAENGDIGLVICSFLEPLRE